MPDDQTLTQARASLNRKRPQDALKRVSRYRVDHPHSVEAAVLEGQSLLALGKHEQAVESLSKFVTAHPDAGRAQSLLGLALTRIGHYRRAAEAFRYAIRAQPRDAWAHFQHGEAQAALGNLNEAARAYQYAFGLRKGFAQAHRRLGDVLMRASANNAAVVAYRDALEIDPQQPEVWADLGNALGRCGNRAKAIECYEQAIKLNPSLPGPLNNLSNALRESGRTAAARRCAEQAVEAAPNDFRCLNTLCLALMAESEFEAAFAAARRALELNPDHANSHFNLGNLHRLTGDLDSAEQAYEQALERDPSHAAASYQLGGLRLQSNDDARGWPLMFQGAAGLEGPSRPAPNLPQWDGSDASGKRILLSASSLLRDTVLLLRYAARLQQLGLIVTVACPAAHAGLALSASGVSAAAPVEEPIDEESFDLAAQLHDLPALLGASPKGVSCDASYLRPPDAGVELWRERLAASDRLKVGIAWRGRKQPTWDQRSSIPLQAFKAVAAVEGLQLVALNRAAGTDDPAQVLGGEVFQPDLYLSENQADNVDVLSLVASLDLVIAVDSVVAHLACAVGTPTWVALEPASDWCWPRTGDRSEWRPAARIFRRGRDADWLPTIESVAQAIRNGEAAIR